jgi:RNA polymerase sigma-70 factor (ECF subfamily)
MHELLRIVEPMIPALRRYARALLKDPVAADDLVQDCLERVISRWRQRRTADDARPWVFSILHNLALSALRQRARRGEHIALDASGEGALATPARQVESVQHRDLLRALDALPDDQRAALLLVSVEDLSYAQAAEALDVPIGTVMSRIARARAKLTQALDGQEHQVTQRPTLRRIK